jgi:hypothetical protein
LAGFAIVPRIGKTANTHKKKPPNIHKSQCYESKKVINMPCPKLINDREIIECFRSKPDGHVFGVKMALWGLIMFYGFQNAGGRSNVCTWS